MDDEYSPLLTVGKMEQLVYLFSTASWTDFPCVYLAFFRSSARYVSCTGDHAAMGRNYRGSFFSTFASGGIAQQESAVTEEKQQTEDRQQRPVTEDSDATIEITRKKSHPMEKRKRHVHLVR